MSQCDDAFQRLQALQRQMAKLQQEHAELQKLTGITEQAPEKVIGPDGAVRRSMDQFLGTLDGEAMNRYIENGMNTKAKADISDAGGQPNNFDRMLRQMDVRTVEDYARLSQALLDTGARINPDGYRFVDDVYGKERVAELVTKAYGDLVKTDKLGQLMAGDVAPFMNLVERMSRLRAASWGFRKNLLEDIQGLASYRAANPGPVPNEMKARFFESLKTALLSERHFDLARSRTGQTLRSLQDELPDLQAIKTELENGAAFTPGDELAGELTLKPGDMEQGGVFSEVAEALDDTNAKRGADKLKQLVMTIQLDGTNSASRLKGMKLFNHQMLLGNLLAKDSQLFNIQTQLVANGGSNFAMAIIGPARQAFENVGNLTPYGTAFSRDAFTNGMGASWKGVKQAMDVVRTSGKEVFMDALTNGHSVFAGNKDTFGKALHANDQAVLRLNAQNDMPFQGGWMANPINWGIMRNKIHASLRLFMYEKTGNPVLLEPGLRLLGATDNLAGLYHHAFKVRNDLEIRARKDGVQLGLTDPASTEAWIDSEFNKAFYSLEPTEADVKAYRRELGLKGEVSDDDIKLEIVNKKIGETYGGPTLNTPESVAAEQYSREMRFQNEPGDIRPESTRGDIAQTAYEGVQRARKNWLVDLNFPYLQSPLMGTLLDMQMTGVTPAIDTLSMMFNPGGFTPAQKARVKANWVVAGATWGSFAILDSQGLIVGNGPLDPDERKEWEADLKRRGLVPNSIAGVPLLGGVPFVNTLFILKDIKSNFEAGAFSKFDQQKALMAGMQVLTGQLMRQTTLGQLKQLYDVLQMKGADPGRYVRYIGAGQIPGIGLIRDFERITGTTVNDFYRDGEPTAIQQQAGAGDDFIEKQLNFLRNLAYGTVGMTGLIGGVRKETDWLGTKINLPFGMRYLEALKHRFFPQLWPEDKVYAELDAQNMLNPPAPLMKGQLDNIAMTDDLQKEWNDLYYSSVGGSVSARFAIAGKQPTISIYTHTRVPLESGAVYDAKTKLISIDVAPFIEKYVKGRTPIQAFRALINSPLYQRMQDAPGTTSDLAVRDMSPAQRRGQAARVLLQTVKDYYEMVATDRLGKSRSPDAQEWQQRRREVWDYQNEQAGNELQDLVKAIGGSQ